MFLHDYPKECCQGGLELNPHPGLDQDNFIGYKFKILGQEMHELGA
jgi:hypothetical protein